MMGEHMPNLPIDPYRGGVDTHHLYNTVSHGHFDVLLDDGSLVELMVVECADGRWYLEGAPCEWQSAPEVCLNLTVTGFREPQFLASEDEATQLAALLFKKHYDFPEEEFARRFIQD